MQPNQPPAYEIPGNYPENTPRRNSTYSNTHSTTPPTTFNGYYSPSVSTLNFQRPATDSVIYSDSQYQQQPRIYGAQPYGTQSFPNQSVPVTLFQQPASYKKTSNSKNTCIRKVIIAVLVFFSLAAIAIGVAIFFVNRDSASSSSSSNTITLTVQSVDTKKDWMTQMAADFNSKNVKINGKTVVINLVNTGSSNMSMKIAPQIWSPQNNFWVDLLSFDRTKCTPIASTSLGFAIWSSMATVLGYPNKKIGWNDLLSLASDSQSWNTIARISGSNINTATWGKFKFGHAHPAYSTSGKLTVASSLYSLNGVTYRDSLTLSNVNNGTSLPQLTTLFQSVTQIAYFDTDLLDLMTANGVSFLHASVTYESNVIKYNIKNRTQLADKLVFIYPQDGTYWSENPYCFVDSNSTPDQSLAGKAFLEFLLSSESQNKLVMSGFRPAFQQGVRLDINTVVGNPFTPDNGVQINNDYFSNPVLQYPVPLVTSAAVSLWENVKKPNTVLVLLEASNLMKGANLKLATSLLEKVVQQMPDRDDLFVTLYSSLSSNIKVSNQTLAASRSEFLSSLNTILPTAGNRFFDALAESIKSMSALVNQNPARYYTILVIGTGADDGSTSTSDSISALLSRGDGKEIKVSSVFFNVAGSNQTPLNVFAQKSSGVVLSGDVNPQDLYVRFSF